MVRHTDEQLLEVCKLCISYLHDKHSGEAGLFRSSVAQTDVRALQSQIIQQSYSKFRDEPDPHLVAEVLQTSFKNLVYPLLYEVYQDIVETGIVMRFFNCLTYVLIFFTPIRPLSNIFRPR
jgi:hypothetical protein